MQHEFSLLGEYRTVEY